MVQGWPTVSMTTLTLLPRVQVCKPLYLLKGPVGVGCEEAGDIFLQASSSLLGSGCLSLILQGEYRELPVWEQGLGQMLAMTSSKKILTHRVEEQNESWQWVWGLGTKWGERERESSDVIQPHSLPSLSVMSSPNTASCLETSRLILSTQYSCLYNSMVTSQALYPSCAILCEPVYIFSSSLA